MEFTEEDINPTIPAGDAPDMGSRSDVGVGKLKQSRYEDVWPEDVHAAFMEAIALYPPMGKRRLKYYRVPALEDERFANTNRTKSFGRCQLIQSYILEKTGKNRSRKQVSSHLQRLKKIHKDNPAMLNLFSDSQTLSGRCTVTKSLANAISSQDRSSSTTAASMRHLKLEGDSDHTIDLPNTDSNSIRSSTSSYASLAEASSLHSSPCSPLNLWTDLQDHSSFLFAQGLLSPVSRRLGCALDAIQSRECTEFHDTLLFKDPMNEGLRSASVPQAFTSVRPWHTSKLPLQSRALGTGPTTLFSRADNSTETQPIHHSTFYDSSIGDSPLVSNPGTLTMPCHPFQLIPSGERFDSGLVSECDWPKNLDVLANLQEGSLDEILLRQPSTTYQYHFTCPTPGTHNFSSEVRAPRLPRGLSYPCTFPGTATLAENVSNKSAIDLPREPPESYNNPAPPLVISPTPVYPISFIHSDIHTHVR